MKNNKPLRIRDIRPDDAGRMHAMIVKLAQATDEAEKIRSDAEDYRRYAFGEQRLVDGVIAERGDAPVGLCLYYLTFSTWLGEPGVYVSDVYVEPGERGTGLGRQLMAAVARKGVTAEATHLRLNVVASNEFAHEFYRRIGMKHRDYEQTWHLGGDDFSRLAESAR